mgnify:CR=1 FL=1
MNNLEEVYFDLIKSIKRYGFVHFCWWLHEETDFLTAPASTKYHGAEKNGLLSHSLYVLHHMLNLTKNTDYSYETILLVSLYHDICKANFYTETTRNVKNDKGKWEQVPYYAIDEQFPYGSHGGKSVYLMMKHGLVLEDEEAIAINNHMGGWDYTTYHNPSNAFDKYPLAVYLHTADILASYISKH